MEFLSHPEHEGVALASTLIPDTVVPEAGDMVSRYPGQGGGSTEILQVLGKFS